MKRISMFLLLAMALVFAAWLLSVPSGAQDGMRGTGLGDVLSAGGNALTNVWSVPVTWPTNAVCDLQSFNGLTLRVSVASGAGTDTGSFKPQWSSDRSNWSDEVVLVAGTASGGEQPYTANIRVVNLTLTNGVSYVERFNRLARYFRVATKSSVASRTALNDGLEIIAVPLNN